MYQPRTTQTNIRINLQQKKNIERAIGLNKSLKKAGVTLENDASGKLQFTTGGMPGSNQAMMEDIIREHTNMPAGQDISFTRISTAHSASGREFQERMSGMQANPPANVATQTTQQAAEPANPAVKPTSEKQPEFNRQIAAQEHLLKTTEMGSVQDTVNTVREAEVERPIDIISQPKATTQPPVQPTNPTQAPAAVQPKVQNISNQFDRINQIAEQVEESKPEAVPNQPASPAPTAYQTEPTATSQNQPNLENPTELSNPYNNPIKTQGVESGESAS